MRAVSYKTIELVMDGLVKLREENCGVGEVVVWKIRLMAETSRCYFTNMLTRTSSQKRRITLQTL